ncbi:ribosome hibernation-promoting factor, HPF/YfiA family, partial [Klebsiella pneumoniae]|uniref:ribosome hibernation-promoting factor, HPF/YfiA family n=1 Tax=Klebsiella pneumoniae TaxID=573 RepID=UPI002181EE8A
MQLNITGHNVEITPAMREFVTAKFSKLEQFFDRINQVYIVLKVEKVTQIADANLHVNGVLWSSFFGHADQMVGLCTGGQLGGRA